MNRTEELLLKLINKDSVAGWECLNRLEQYLVCCIAQSGIDLLGEPMNRLEELLAMLYYSIGQGGGSQTKDEIVTNIVENSTPMLVNDPQDGLVPTEFNHVYWTEEEAAEIATEQVFYQVVNINDEVIESGYQELCPLLQTSTFTIALPSSINQFRCEKYDILANEWREVSFTFAKAANQTAIGYTIWEVPIAFAQPADGDYYRFVILG